MKSTLAVIALLFALTVPTFAHHSFAAEYDGTKPVTFTGTFVNWEWVNPHSWIEFTVKGPDGKVATWRAEALPPNSLYKNGWRKNMIKPGETITIRGNLAKDGANLMWASNVTLQNGETLGLGSSPSEALTGAAK